MKTKTQTPNPKYHNTAIFVGDNPELREKAIKFYEENGFNKFLDTSIGAYIVTDKDSYMALDHIDIEGLENGDSWLKIITLPEINDIGIVRHKTNGKYFRGMIEGIFYYTESVSKAAKYNSFEEFCNENYPIKPIVAVRSSWEFLPMENVEKDENKSQKPSKFDSVLLESLTLRTINCLKTAEIYTLQQLKSKSMKELGSIRNLGKRCLEEIERFLANQPVDNEMYKFENITLGHWYSDEQMVAALNEFHKKGWETIKLEETRGSGYAKILLKRIVNR